MAPHGEIDKPGKLYLGNLAIETDESSIEAAFKKFGKISEVQIIKHRETGVSKGFGFVTFQNPDDADDAVKGMEGKELDNNIIKVDHAIKTGGRDRGRGRGRGMDRGRGSDRGRGRGRESYEERDRDTGVAFRSGRGRSSGGPYMRGRGGPPRGGRGASRFGGREPLLNTPDDYYGQEEADDMYQRPGRRYKEEVELPPARRPVYRREYDERPLPGREPLLSSSDMADPGLLEREDVAYERRSYRSEALLPSREARLPAREGRLVQREARPTMARESASYDAILPQREVRSAASAYGRDTGYERPARASAAPYPREAAAPYRRELDPYAKEAAYDRPEVGLAPRKVPAASEDVYGRDAVGGYPASRVQREYGAERSGRAELGRDPYARDPYALPAREAPSVRDYPDRARELPPASRERDPYGARPEYGASAREPLTRSATYARESPARSASYAREPPARSPYAREPAAREFAAERNGTYGREKDLYGKPDTRGAYGDDYRRAGPSERPMGGGAAPARLDAYSSRDPYAMPARAEKGGYGARDSYGAQPLGARGARPEGGPAGASRGYAQR